MAGDQISLFDKITNDEKGTMHNDIRENSRIGFFLAACHHPPTLSRTISLAGWSGRWDEELRGVDAAKYRHCEIQWVDLWRP